MGAVWLKAAPSSWVYGIKLSENRADISEIIDEVVYSGLNYVEGLH